MLSVKLDGYHSVARVVPYFALSNRRVSVPFFRSHMDTLVRLWPFFHITSSFVCPESLDDHSAS